MMIRRVLLGVILASMVSAPICAMQAMRRAAIVGARAMIRTEQVIPQGARKAFSHSSTFSAFKGRIQRFAENPFEWIKLTAIGTGSLIFQKIKLSILIQKY